MATVISSIEEARREAELVGLPLLVVSSFTLGGMGTSGLARSFHELDEIVAACLTTSPAGRAVVVRYWEPPFREMTEAEARERLGRLTGYTIVNAIICAMEMMGMTWLEKPLPVGAAAAKDGMQLPEAIPRPDVAPETKGE
jgi:carbamoylphosphate synthase large subunit